jgi:hypothetical protein
VQRNRDLIERINVRWIFSGPGGSQTVVDVGVDKATETISPDGSTVVVTVWSSGSLQFHQVVPGSGSIVNNSDHEIVQITLEWDEASGDYVEVDFQVMFDAGPNDDVSGADFDLICEQLARRRWV